jgi:hypothetical protein
VSAMAGRQLLGNMVAVPSCSLLCHLVRVWHVFEFLIGPAAAQVGMLSDPPEAT